MTAGRRRLCPRVETRPQVAAHIIQMIGTYIIIYSFSSDSVCRFKRIGNFNRFRRKSDRYNDSIVPCLYNNVQDPHIYIYIYIVLRDRKRKHERLIWIFFFFDSLLSLPFIRSTYVFYYRYPSAITLVYYYYYNII